MKKLFFLLFGLFLSLNLSYASDLISKASNGVLNENSLGVKKLSDEEMRQVKGGYFRLPYLDTSTRDYWLITDDFYAKWNNDYIMPTDGVLKVAKEMGFSGQYVIIVGYKDTNRFAMYRFAFRAYDTNNRDYVSNPFREDRMNRPEINKYIQSKLDAFEKYARSDYAYRF